MTIYEDVVFSPEVVSDIAEISRYIRAKHTKEAANKYIDISDDMLFVCGQAEANIVRPAVEAVATTK